MGLLIVILGLLLGLFGTTYTGVQSQAQDTERKTDLKSIQSQLEAYFASNGVYPTLADVNNATWRHANMRGMDDGALQDPHGSAAQLSDTPGKNIYSYQVRGDNGQACNDTKIDCTNYVLTATLDDGHPFTEQSLN